MFALDPNFSVKLLTKFYVGTGTIADCIFCIYYICIFVLDPITLYKKAMKALDYDELT